MAMQYFLGREITDETDSPEGVYDGWIWYVETDDPHPEPVQIFEVQSETHAAQIVKVLKANDALRAAALDVLDAYENERMMGGPIQHLRSAFAAAIEAKL